MSDPLDFVIGDNTKEALRMNIERIESLEEDKKTINEDIKEVFAEAKSQGFDVKIMRQVLKRRKLEREERNELDDLIKVYEDAIESPDDMLK